MADTQSDSGNQSVEVDEQQEASLLEQILAADENSLLKKLMVARGQAGVEEVRTLLTILVSYYLQGNVAWKGNLTSTVHSSVALLDGVITKQLRKVYQAKPLRDLEGRWYGLQELLRNTEVGADLKIKLLDSTQSELHGQFIDAPAVDRSPLFNMVYQHEYGTAGGEPYGLMLVDFQLSHKGKDVDLMRCLGEVGAASHCPVILAANPDMFGLPNFKALSEGRPIAPGFQSPTYADWNAFRDSNDAHYLVLTMPRTMARLPYGAETDPVEKFHFEEIERDENNLCMIDQDRDFVWSNACFDMGLKMTEAFYNFGWCTAIRGHDNGGKVENLPNFTYTSDAGDTIQQCPSEVNITDEQEKELSDLGFLPLIHYKDQNFAVFLGAQTAQKPKEYTNPDATSNAAISARLPYVMASSRIAHYIKVIGRDRIGSSLTPEDVQKELSDWLNQYTNSNAIGNAARAKFPLRESSVSVVEQPGRPGCYSAIAYLRPWLQMEELAASVRTVASIPS